MKIRAVRRAATLVFALSVSILRLGLARLSGPFTLQRRALWIQSTARLVIFSLGIPVRISGRPPTHGLIVSNHLSHFDTAVYASIVSCSMVAKAEVARWPVFGMMARASGALFVDRSSRSSAVLVTQQVAERLNGALPVLFFPEGTSTDGSEVLRFHSRLFTPAVEAGIQVTGATIRYVFEDARRSVNCAGLATCLSCRIFGRCSARQISSLRSISASRGFTLIAAQPPTKPTKRSQRCASQQFAQSCGKNFWLYRPIQ